MDYIERIQGNGLKAFLDGRTEYKNVLLVEGARQTGKTTLVEHTLESRSETKHVLNLEKQTRLLKLIDECEEFSEFEELLKDDLGFSPDKNEILFIDESQESLRLGSFVRFMKESWPQSSVILSGSTLSRLFRENQRFPTGRVDRLMVSGFAFSEFLSARGRQSLSTLLENPQTISRRRHEKLLSLYDEYLNVGGLPAVILEFCRDGDWRRRLEELIADYYEDLRRLFGDDDSAVAKACFRSVAHFVGSASKNSTVIPSPSSSTNHKINEVFSRLEDWHLVLKSTQMGQTPERSYGYRPKRYLFDTGFLRRIRETGLPSIETLNTSQPAARTVLGGIFENQTAIELCRDGGELSGWKKSSAGGEIDFVLKIDGRTIPLECKATLSLKMTHLRGIIGYLEQYNVPLGLVCSPAPFQDIHLANGKRIRNIPIYSAQYINPSFAVENEQYA